MFARVNVHAYICIHVCKRFCKWSARAFIGAWLYGGASFFSPVFGVKFFDVRAYKGLHNSQSPSMVSQEVEGRILGSIVNHPADFRKFEES